MKTKSRRLLLILAAAAALVALPVYSVFGGGSDPNPPREFSVYGQTAVSDSFTYQGRLTENNQPANGTYDFQFTIYGAASGSAQVCTTPANDIETRDDVAVTNGVFTVELDFCAEAFDGDARWLEIGVRAGNATGTYTILSPRQPISPTPYALYSKRTGGLQLPFIAEGETTGDQALFEIEQTETTDAGPALEIDGAIKVSGNKAAFSVAVDDTASTGNVCDSDGDATDDAVVLPDEIANEASDILLITVNGLPDFDRILAVAFSPGEDCPDAAWVAYAADGAAITDGLLINVLVIKQEVIQ